MTRPKSYAQALKEDVNEIIKIKDAFPKLSPKIILEIHKVINNLDMKGYQCQEYSMKYIYNTS